MDDYYYDDYDDGHFDDDLLEEDSYSAPQHTFSDTLSSCVHPSLVQISTYIGTFMIWNLIFSISTQTVKVPSNLKHLLSIICGTFMLYYTIGTSVITCLVFTITNVAVYRLAQYIRVQKFGYILTGFCMATLILGELLEKDAKLCHQIRGTQMIVVMKLISLGFDLDAGKFTQSNQRNQHVTVTTPNIIETMGYVMCPANCILGPWVSYTDYNAIYQSSTGKWRWIHLYWILINTIASIGFLLCSNCFIALIIPENSWRWFNAYRDAMSFRFSHYFISFLSQAMMVTGGFSNAKETIPGTSTHFWGYQITNPITIEWPRSIVQVVIYWNISMHNWLKTYVFRIMKPHGTFTAIFTTYIISALLHGLNFQLAAVLLSLGIYTYVEYKLRAKLSTIFSACILATPCKLCQHEHKWHQPYVFVFNGIFGVLAVLHLAYLGVMFEASFQIQEQGFSYTHALEKWSSLSFLSHWIIGGLYLFYKLI